MKNRERDVKYKMDKQTLLQYRVERTHYALKPALSLSLWISLMLDGEKFSLKCITKIKKSYYNNYI